MKKDFDPKSSEDAKVMSVIIFYEELILNYQKKIARLQEFSQVINFEDSDKKKLQNKIEKLSQENINLKNEIIQLNNFEKANEETFIKDHDKDILKSICDILNSEYFEIIASVKKLKNDSHQLRLINAAIFEVHSELSQAQMSENMLDNFNYIRTKIIEMKLSNTQSLIFRSQLIKALEVNTDVENYSILKICNTLPYFKQLFHLKTDINTEADKIYIFMHELHSFMQYLKIRLNQEQNIEIFELIGAAKDKLRVCN